MINWRDSHDRPTARYRATGRSGDQRSPARADREGTDGRTGADLAAHRLRRRSRPGPAALAADVAAGLGPRAHRQPGRTLAAARGRRPRTPPPGDRPALRRVRASPLGAPDVAP